MGKKLARSQSIKLCEKLKIPVPGRERSSSRESNRVNNEGEEEEEDSSTPTKLPILRSFHSVSKQISEKKQTNGVASDCRGLVQYEDLLSLLTCLQCRCLVSPPVAQCRKGHLYCLSCKSENTAVEQLQDLQADVCGRAQPGVGEDGGVDRVALQVRRERLH